MSIEKHERSPSFRARQQTAKINHHSKLLPSGFFPKTLSQSPKKRPEGPTSAQVLQWFERQESKERGQVEHQFHRFSHANRPSTSRIILCAIQQPAQIQKKRYDLDQNCSIDGKVGVKLIYPPKINGNQQKTEAKVKIMNKELMKIQPILNSDKGQKIIRVIRSESKPKRRNETPEQVKKSTKISKQRKSVYEKPKQGLVNEVTVGFDGLITFSRLK